MPRTLKKKMLQMIAFMRKILCEKILFFIYVRGDIGSVLFFPVIFSNSVDFVKQYTNLSGLLL